MTEFFLTKEPRKSVELLLRDGRVITGKRGGLWKILPALCRNQMSL